MLDRRQFLAASAGAWPALLGCSSAPPNVLLLMVDDLNDWIGAMVGHPQAKTPNIDRLAARGVTFMNAHCQAPICGPSRASLMTGLLPSTTGIYGQINDRNLRGASETIADLPFLPEALGRTHQTMGVGKLFHNHAPDGVFDKSGGREAGFGPKPPERLKWDRAKTSTDWGPFPDRDEEMPDSRTAAWAIERLEEERNNPFFLAVGFLRPHVPWHVPKKWFDLYPPGELEMPPYLPGDHEDVPEISKRLHEVPMMPTTEWARESGEWRNIVQAYLACVSFVDHQVGRVLDALEAGPYGDSTVVVLCGDHGYHIGEKNRFAKHSVWEEATRTPLIIAGPGIEQGRRCTKPVGLIDLYPTLLDYCGALPEASNEGYSLRPLLEDPEADWPHMAITTYGRNNHAVRSEHFRYIRYEDGSEELYDHRVDDAEWKNLADDPEYAQVKRDLARHLPTLNAPWSPNSIYDYNDYLREHRKRNL